MKFLQGLMLSMAMIFSAASFAGVCAPLNPDQTFLAPMCNLKDNPRDCRQMGSCAWQDDDGNQQLRCVPMDESQSAFAGLCNLKSRQDCNGICAPADENGNPIVHCVPADPNNAPFAQLCNLKDRNDCNGICTWTWN